MKLVFYSRANPPKALKRKSVPTVFKVKETVKMADKLDESTGLYEIVTVTKVINEYDTKLLTDSYIGQTGLEAVMKRVAITGDTSLLNTISATSDSVFDSTKLPKTLGEAKALGESVDSLFSDIPDELKKGQSVTDFLANVTSADIDAYIESLKALKAKKDGNSDE